MTEPLRLPSDALDLLLRSDALRDVLGVDDPKLLAHEHVMQRKPMVARTLTASADQIRVHPARGRRCTVLREPEHRTLSAVEGVDGWEPYRQANIPVYDCGENGTDDPRPADWGELGLA